mmetsp:Transcript_45499/g.105482  ORF Transcript_45499/g.105482 Transcript_45499/m.105482 type:complete len:212 (+) Transcript_45499:306-941(+)
MAALAVDFATRKLTMATCRQHNTKPGLKCGTVVATRVWRTGTTTHVQHRRQCRLCRLSQYVIPQARNCCCLRRQQPRSQRSQQARASSGCGGTHTMDGFVSCAESMPMRGTCRATCTLPEDAVQNLTLILSRAGHHNQHHRASPSSSPWGRGHISPNRLCLHRHHPLPFWTSNRKQLLRQQGHLNWQQGRLNSNAPAKPFFQPQAPQSTEQ